MSAVTPREPAASDVRVTAAATSFTALAHPALIGSIAEGGAVLVATPAGTARATAGIEALVVGGGAPRSLPPAHGSRMTGEVQTRSMRGLPVVVAASPEALPLVAAGARVAGAEAIGVLTLPEADPGVPGALRSAGAVDRWIACADVAPADLHAVTLWLGLLDGTDDLDVLLIAGGAPPEVLGRVMQGIRFLEGAPVAALGASHGSAAPVGSSASLAMLAEACPADVNVAVPAIEDGPAREAFWGSLRAARLEERHQLVEVDGRLAQPAPSGPHHLPETSARSAGAAGILAARMAAGARAWRGAVPGPGHPVSDETPLSR